MADKIVSWGGIDSKGTSGMGVTGSLTVSGSIGIGTATPSYNLEVSSTGYNGVGIMSGANSTGEINFQNRGYALPKWTIRSGGAPDGSSGNLTFQRLASTFPVTITADENLLVGTTLDSARLTVKGSGTTSSTTALLVQNANASASMVVRDDGNVGIGNSSPSSLLSVGLQTGGTAATLADFRGGSDNDFIQVARTTVTDRGVKLYSSGQIIASSVYTSEAAYLFNNASSNTTTTGNRKFFQISGNWSPATGTSTWAQTLLTPTISASGDYSGTVRGIYYNPTVDSTTYGAHRAIETTAGDVVFSGGKVGIGTSTTYGLQVANTSSLLVSATGIIAGYSTGSAAISITPHIYATAGNRTYYSMYIGNPGITTSGSFGSYDFKSLVTAGGAVFNGGILAGDSRFYATSNAVSFQGYNPYNGQTGTAAGGITFTARQVEGSDEAGIGAYYGNGSRLYIYNKYNASDSKIIFSVGGTIRSSFFGTGNLSIGNGETDMSARLGVKGSGTTSSTTALLVQNANSRTSFIVNDDGRVGINVAPYDSYALAVDPISGSTGVYVAQRAVANNTNEYRFVNSSGTPSAGYTAGSITWHTLSYLEGIYTSDTISGYRTVDLRIQGWSGSYAETIRFTYDNKVGIGTTSPSAKLHVAGNTIITGSLTVSSTTAGSSENTLTLGPAPAGGAGEGGQLGFNATGGTYTSASFIDLWQNKLRVLKGTNVGSAAEVANFDLQTLYLNLPGGAVTMPQRPAFRVTGSSGYNPTANTVISGSSVGIDYNQGGYYNNTNGQFTCPVAGLYHVWYVGRTFAASLASVALYKNNTGTPLAFWESNANSGHFGTSAVVSLAVNDVITAKVTAGQVTFDGNDNWGAAYIG